ncbi:MAG: M48 family metallopeptidase [Desulfobacterales bacterium]|jgi:Zn-dependent protease with chaperone function
MDFFKEQDKSRTKTTQLIGLFILAVLAVVLAVYSIAVFILFSYGARQPGFNPAEFNWVQPHLGFWVVSITLLVIFIGSITKIIALAKGGRSVAENLGGRLIHAATTDSDERRLINVVEEMSIASGIAVPQVYILDREKGINAFAAGYAPNDAVVAVTRNCLKLLNRDELQGVIAHEFSHILNGDMRLNIRLIGLLSGIMVIANIGYLILRFRTGSRKSSAQIVLIGIGLLVIGFVGQLFGRIIQAAVSRQREYFSDASAVQFTRNPTGISGALKKIGGFMPGSGIRSPHAGEICHMFFGKAIRTLFATHPPLTDRIQRLDPDFDGQFLPLKISDEELAPVAPALKKPEVGIAEQPVAAFAIDAESVIKRPGHITAADLNHGMALLAAIPHKVKNDLNDILGSILITCALLLDRDPAVKTRQIKNLQTVVSAAIIRQISIYENELKDVNPQLRLPILDLALPSLRQMSIRQYAKFKEVIQILVAADAQLSLFEFALQEIITHRLGATFKGHKKEIVYRNIASLALDAVNILSKLAHVGHPEEAAARAAFNAGWAKLRIRDSRWDLLPATKVTFRALHIAMKKFSLAPPGVKKTILDACAHCVMHDQTVTANEAELLRAVAYSFDIPLPPFIETWGN